MTFYIPFYLSLEVTIPCFKFYVHNFYVNMTYSELSGNFCWKSHRQKIVKNNEISRDSGFINIFLGWSFIFILIYLSGNKWRFKGHCILEFMLNLRPRIEEKIDVKNFALQICNYIVLYPLDRYGVWKAICFLGGHTYIFVPLELPN